MRGFLPCWRLLAHIKSRPSLEPTLRGITARIPFLLSPRSLAVEYDDQEPEVERPPENLTTLCPTNSCDRNLPRDITYSSPNNTTVDRGMLLWEVKQRSQDKSQEVPRLFNHHHRRVPSPSWSNLQSDHPTKVRFKHLPKSQEVPAATVWVKTLDHFVNTEETMTKNNASCPLPGNERMVYIRLNTGWQWRQEAHPSSIR